MQCTGCISSKESGNHYNALEETPARKPKNVLKFLVSAGCGIAMYFTTSHYAFLNEDCSVDGNINCNGCKTESSCSGSCQWNDNMCKLTPPKTCNEQCSVCSTTEDCAQSNQDCVYIDKSKANFGGVGEGCVAFQNVLNCQNCAEKSTYACEPDGRCPNCKYDFDTETCSSKWNCGTIGDEDECTGNQNCIYHNGNCYDNPNELCNDKDMANCCMWTERAYCQWDLDKKVCYKDFSGKGFCSNSARSLRALKEA